MAEQGAHNSLVTGSNPVRSTNAQTDTHLVTMYKLRVLPDLFLLLLLLAPLYAALTPGGLPNTADGQVHFVRSAEMVQAWQDGVWFPGWAANLGHGYGLPLFLFAPPLPYWLTACFHQFGFQLESAFKLMLATGILVAGGGAYALCRSLLGRPAGVVGAAAFLYAPILLRELFIQGNVAQYWAWAWAPWAAYGIIQLYRHIDYRAMVVLTVALAGAILSHNAIALLVAALVGTMAVMLWLFTRSAAGFIATAIGALFGLGISAWFWLPALLENRYLRLDRIVASDFRSRFVPVTELLALSPRLDIGAINPAFPLTLGAVPVGLALAGVLVLVVQTLRGHWKWAEVGHPSLIPATGCYFILFAGFCAWMATQPSELLWGLIPFLDLFEWPFRWHGFTAIGLSWLAALAVASATTLRVHFAQLQGIKAVEITAVVACVLLIGSALVNLYPRMLAPGTLRGAPADIVRFERRSAAIGTTSLGEFDPIWTNGQLSTLPIPAEYRRRRPVNRLPETLPPDAQGIHIASSVQQHRFHLHLPEPATLSFKLLYFPGWAATSGGVTLPVAPHPETGLIEVQLPAGDHELHLRFGPTRLRQVARAITLLSGLALLGVFIYQWRASRGGAAGRWPNQKAEPGPSFRFVALLTGCILLMISVRGWLPGWFQVHTPPDQTPPLALRFEADFDGQLRLLGADRPPEMVAPGDVLDVVTYWRALQPLDQDYALFLHLDEPDGTTVAAVDYRHPADIPTSTWSPNLYVRAPLRLRVPPDLPPISYQMRVGVVERRTGDWLGLRDGLGEVVDIASLWLTEPGPTHRKGKPLARYGATIDLLDVGYDRQTAATTLFWQTTQAVGADYVIFVHALASDGTLLGQSDDTPYQGRYPTSRWRPEQVIIDERLLGQTGLDPTLVDRLVIGLYSPTSGERLPAYDAAGEQLGGSSLVVVIRR
jgi:hypothetical protein